MFCLLYNNYYVFLTFIYYLVHIYDEYFFTLISLKTHLIYIMGTIKRRVTNSINIWFEKKKNYYLYFGCHKKKSFKLVHYRFVMHISVITSKKAINFYIETIKHPFHKYPFLSDSQLTTYIVIPIILPFFWFFLSLEFHGPQSLKLPFFFDPTV